MKNKTLNATVDVHQDHFLINEQYAVVYQKRIWSTDNPDLLELLPKSTSECKVIESAHLEDFYNDKTVKGLSIQYATPQELEIARTQGFVNFLNHMDNRKPKSPQQKFEELKSVSDLENHMVIMDSSAHQLRDLNNQYLPIATFFSYIENMLREGTHDLEKVLRLFQFRSDITVVDETKFKYKNIFEALAQGWDIAASSDREIFDIPDYNCDEDSTLSVQFLWVPSKEDFQQMMGLYDGKYKSIHTTAIMNDVFGLSICEKGRSLKHSM